MSGLFRGSQMNWACLTKEAYVIYMLIKNWPITWKMLILP